MADERPSKLLQNCDIWEMPLQFQERGRQVNLFIDEWTDSIDELTNLFLN